MNYNADMETKDYPDVKQIRPLGKEVGKTLRNIAAETGISEKMLSAIVNRRSRVYADQLYDISRSLEKPITIFFPEENSP
jgi:transcriptional regulator with XRE-family HTH domain